MRATRSCRATMKSGELSIRVTRGRRRTWFALEPKPSPKTKVQCPQECLMTKDQGPNRRMRRNERERLQKECDRKPSSLQLEEYNKRAVPGWRGIRVGVRR